MIQRFGLLVALLASPVCSFAPKLTTVHSRSSALEMGAESEVSFSTLDGSAVRVGIIRTRWNDADVTRLVEGARKGLTECKVTDENIFETEVPGAFELPFAAKLLAMSGTVDAVICAGVLVKGDTMHFEYIADAVSKGIMNVGMSTNVPCIFGVLTCLTDDQVKARSTGDSNHGVDWGKTAVEMALLKNEAMGVGGKMSGMGFGQSAPLKSGVENPMPPAKEKKVGF